MPGNFEMTNFIAMLQAIEYYIDDHKINTHIIFKQNRKLTPLIKNLKETIGSFVRDFSSPNLIRIDLRKHIDKGEDLKDYAFDSKKWIEFFDYSEDLTRHYNNIIKISYMYEKEPKKVTDFIKELKELNNKYGLD